MGIRQVGHDPLAGQQLELHVSHAAVRIEGALVEKEAAADAWDRRRTAES